jgi:hypothetical protein
MHLAKLKVSNECLSLRKQKQTLSFKKIMYFLLCTMKLKNRMHWKWQTKTPKGAHFSGEKLAMSYSLPKKIEQG